MSSHTFFLLATLTRVSNQPIRDTIHLHNTHPSPTLRLPHLLRVLWPSLLSMFSLTTNTNTFYLSKWRASSASWPRTFVSRTRTPKSLIPRPWMRGPGAAPQLKGNIRKTSMSSILSRYTKSTCPSTSRALDAALSRERLSQSSLRRRSATTWPSA